MELRPLNDRVVVKRIEEETKTAGGIIIPDNHKEKPSQGKIVAVGKGHRLANGEVKALELKVGDTVLFGKWNQGAEVKVAGETLLIMKEDEILGVLQ